MSSTLNKITRIVVAIALCACIVFSCVACAKMPRNLDETDQICVSGALYESWMYILTDDDFISQVVTTLESLEYEKSDEAVDMMTEKGVLCLSLSKGNENITKFIVDKNGRFCFEAGTQAYVITSEFDFEEFKALVDKEIESVKESLNATADEA